MYKVGQYEGQKRRWQIPRTERVEKEGKWGRGRRREGRRGVIREGQREGRRGEKYVVKRWLGQATEAL